MKTRKQIEIELQEFSNLKEKLTQKSKTSFSYQTRQRISNLLSFRDQKFFLSDFQTKFCLDTLTHESHLSSYDEISVLIANNNAIDRFLNIPEMSLWKVFIVIFIISDIMKIPLKNILHGNISIISSLFMLFFFYTIILLVQGRLYREFFNERYFAKLAPESKTFLIEHIDQKIENLTSYRDSQECIEYSNDMEELEKEQKYLDEKREACFVEYRKEDNLKESEIQYQKNEF